MRWLERCRWWLVSTTIVPAVLVGVGGIFLVYKLAAQQAEIGRLRTELSTCQSQTSAPTSPCADQHNACALSLGGYVDSERVSVDDDHGVEIELNGASGGWFSWSVSPDEADAFARLLNQVANQKRKQVNKQGPLL